MAVKGFYIEFGGKRNVAPQVMRRRQASTNDAVELFPLLIIRNNLSRETNGSKRVIGHDHRRHAWTRERNHHDCVF